MVSYYSAILRERGHRVVRRAAGAYVRGGRFREETMAFPPGVTIKDYYTWSGAAGYANPVPGNEPTHYRTVIQIVPAVGGR